MTFVEDVRSKAKGHWEAIFQRLDIPTNRSEGECPSCGGKTRYRFDDREGRGTYHCSHCGAGTGLDLVMKVNQCDARSAAELVAGVMVLPLPEPKPARDKPQSNIAIADKVAALVAKTVSGESQYLLNKGLPSPSKALLSDGSLLLVLQGMDGTTTGAQVINPDGSKRLLAGTAKKGSFIPVRLQSPTEDEQPVTVLIAEGYATGVTVSLLDDGVVLAALDEGNLIHVAKVCRAKWPLAKIIIAADNDWHELGECDEKGKPKQNVGVISAEKAAISVSGWVATPPTHHKADWDDYRQQNGTEATTRAFTESLYQPKGAKMKATVTAIHNDKNSRPALSQMAASQRGELLAERYGQITVNPESETVYRYNGERWEKVPDSELQREMVAIFNENETPYSPTGIKNAIEAMKLQVPVMTTQPRYLIGFKNGVYDLRENAFRAHKPEDWLLNHNGITFTQPLAANECLEVHASNFYKWLSHAAGRDAGKMERIKAGLFMVLANRYDWQLFLEITGEGGSGKSVFTHIATLLTGEHNTASGNMAALDSARGRAQFVGKSLILLPDQSKYVGEGTGIKAITGGDLLEIDGKYEKQFSIILQSVVLATNNEPMNFTERQGGIARRRVIFSFNNPVSDDEKDPLLSEKISVELPVIIRHLLTEFASQDKAKLLLLEQRNSDEALEVKRGTDPVIDLCAALYFMSEARGLLMGGGKSIESEPKKYLYHLYKEFLEFQGLGKPLAVTSFGKAMKNAANEYGKEYKTREINGRKQTNVGLTEKVNGFLPHVWGLDTPD